MKRMESLTDSTQRIENVVRAFCDAWNHHDMDAFAALFAEDAEFVNVVGLWWKGRGEIKRAHVATHITMFKNSRLAITGVTVRFVKLDVAVARATWELTGHLGSSGEALPKRRGVLMNLVVRADSEWKILDAQNTDIMEGMLAPPQHD
ncbi:MAG: SgcJ/EcaC family oxidoreductase [Gammaproteobacteria bacterium]